MPEKGQRDKEAAAATRPTPATATGGGGAGSFLLQDARSLWQAMPSQPQTKCIKKWQKENNAERSLLAVRWKSQKEPRAHSAKRGKMIFLLCNKQKSRPLGPVVQTSNDA